MKTDLSFRFKAPDEQPRVGLLTENNRYDEFTSVTLTASSSTGALVLNHPQTPTHDRTYKIVAHTPNGKHPATLIDNQNNMLFRSAEDVKIIYYPAEENTENQLPTRTVEYLGFTPTKNRNFLPDQNLPTELQINESEISYADVISKIGTPRSPTQQQVMHGSAQDSAHDALETMLEQHGDNLKNIIGIDTPTFNRIKKEWCHLRAFSLNGEQNQNNLKAGSAHFNTSMMIYEELVKFIIYANHQLHGFAKTTPSVCLRTTSEVYTHNKEVLKSFIYEFRDLRIRKIEDANMQISIRVQWDQPLTMKNKPSTEGRALATRTIKSFLGANNQLAEEHYSPDPKKQKLILG